jgi:probable F420-dependent oxidoreductase
MRIDSEHVRSVMPCKGSRDLSIDTGSRRQGMQIGAFIFPTDYSIRIDELARALEERGFESLFVTEHTHIPTSRRTPWPGGGPLPKEYSHTLDPFVGLAAAAAVTSRLRLGTGICLVIQHDPIVTAKEVATLDLLSNGRFLFGVGAGWNVEEIEHHGTAFPTRFRVMRERVLAMKEIWTREEAEFHGEFVRFDRIWSYPKPVQKPHPPVLLGGEGPHTLRRVVEFCDGWFPRGRAGADTILAQLDDLRDRAGRAGRDPRTISVSVFGGKPDVPAFERYRAAGIDRVLLPLPSEGRERILPLLDQYTGFLR